MKNMKKDLAILGPEESYSHILSKKLFSNKEPILCNSLQEVFNKVIKGESNKGLVPLENMIHGTVRETINYLKKSGLKIIQEIDFPIRLVLASKSKDFETIISKKEALSQCSNYIEKVNKKTEESPSTSKAMEKASKDKKYAAIGSKEASEVFQLKIISEDISNEINNKTRFILISKEENKETLKNPRTSILITPKKDYPGLLYEILSHFKKEDINLTKIESLPTEKKVGEYEFFIEFEEDSRKEKIKEILEELKGKNKVVSYGTYNLKEL